MVLEDSGFPHSSQTAYIRHRSCIDGVFSTYELLKQMMDEGDSPYLCLFDLEKAFDSIEYEVLLNHLRCEREGMAFIEELVYQSNQRSVPRWESISGVYCVQRSKAGLPNSVLFGYNSLSLFNTFVMPIVLYGCECWYCTEQIVNRLASFQAEVGRRILKLPRCYNNSTALVGRLLP